MIKVSKYYIRNLKAKHDEGVPFKLEELNRFFCKNEKKYIACDNSSGKCRIETFKHIGAVYDFLNTDKPVEQILEEDKNMGYTVEGDING